MCDGVKEGNYEKASDLGRFGDPIRLIGGG
jgi:hypothetical protein